MQDIRKPDRGRRTAGVAVPQFGPDLDPHDPDLGKQHKSVFAHGVSVGTWPAELAPQARYLYGRGLGSALVTAAIARGWTVEPSPHLAYHTAAPGRRLYMRPSLAPLDYVARWEDSEALRRVGNHARKDVERELWPWLKQMGFADDGDDSELLRFLDECLGRRPAHMRPGLRFRRVWTSAEAEGLGSGLARPSATNSTTCSPLRMSRHWAQPRS
jgi:hypothetical protein